MDPSRRDALLKEYGEVSNNFRLLTDIRFKLLAFLPIAAAAAAAILSNDRATVPGLALSLFGLVVTLGLVTYNTRNDQLYNELTGRASTIERNLGLPDGGFAHRPRAWLVVKFWGKKWKVDHGTGVGTIYRASVALWLFGVFASILELTRRFYLDLGLPSFPAGAPSIWRDPSIWVNFAALGLAILVTYRANKMLKSQRECREDKMRGLARTAVEMATPFDLTTALDNDEFVEACALLSEDNEERDKKRKKEEEIRARLEFYASVDPYSRGYYLPRGPDELSASYLVALLTDLPPQWIFDCATNRKGKITASNSNSET